MQGTKHQARRRLPASKLVIILMVCTQAVLYSGFAYLVMQGSTRAVRESEQDTFRMISGSIQRTIEHELDAAELALITALQNEQVVSIFAARDRDRLLTVMQPVYTSLSPRISHISFYLNDGTSFLRVQNPERFDNHIANSRDMAAAVLSAKKTIRGLEKDSAGIALRIITPVYRGAECIGAAEFGVDFGTHLLSTLRRWAEGEYFIFLFNENGESYLSASESDLRRCPLAEQSIDKLRKGEPAWTMDCVHARAVALYPFTSFDGTVAGFIKADVLKLPLSDELSSIRSRLILLGIILALTLTMSAAGAIAIVLKPLSAVVAETQDIAQKIDEGNLDFRGSITSLAPDFQEVIDAVNTIISSLCRHQTLLQAIVEGIPGMVFFIDDQSRVLWANELILRAAPNIIGSDPQQNDNPFFRFETELLSASFFTGDITVIEADDEREHKAVPVRNEAGKVTHIIRISTDISRIKQSERKLRDLNENFERKIQEEIGRRKEGERIADQQSRLASIGVQMATHGLDLILDLAENIPDIIGNPYQYEQVLLNLLSNARDSIEERIIRDAERNEQDPLPARVRITTYVSSSSVVLEIEDSGISLSDEICARVFDPFFTTKKIGRGTGLGLSISYGIIREMNGHITLEPTQTDALARVTVPVIKE